MFNRWKNDKTKIYVGFSSIDRKKAATICQMLHKSGYQVLDTEHNANNLRQYQRNVQRLEDAAVVIAIASPESLNSAHIWREIATANALSKPMIPVVVEAFEGVMPLINPFNATLDDAMEEYYQEALAARVRKSLRSTARYQSKRATQVQKEVERRQKRATTLNKRVTQSMPRRTRRATRRARAVVASATTLVVLLGVLAQALL